MPEYYTISELTRAFRITARTLRFYEEQGLLQPLRQGNRRLYTQADRNRLRTILLAKRLNFSLAEIAALLAMYDTPVQEAKTLQNMLVEINKKRGGLKQMHRDIDDMIHEMERIEEICFRRLAELGVNH
ncbi:MAG: MerR family transcriptional regulator [Candidatus Tokpelaia hoelldobleri]|uniref:MerR family transcriptional regulator n=1 Tax=Candidatus Tokpelaia hoelldobleri TaxID=1902579 RepID=A0A1U9JU73_9HYPH|nr:MAG: MerR family transcriptional regulator [Candidatus Tokpelaia hoelldoblerii]